MTHRVNATVSRRNPFAYLALVVVFLVIAVTSWVFAFRAEQPSFPVTCEVPKLGKTLSSTALVGQAPAAPKDIPVRVLNANGESGQAAELADHLSEIGFTLQADTPFANDPVTAEGGLNCFGQLRFGAQFQASATTLHALFPCFELVVDGREDPSVDIALGAGYQPLRVGGLISDTMNSLNDGTQVDAETLKNLTPRTCA